MTVEDKKDLECDFLIIPHLKRGLTYHKDLDGKNLSEHPVNHNDLFVRTTLEIRIEVCKMVTLAHLKINGLSDSTFRIENVLPTYTKYNINNIGS